MQFLPKWSQNVSKFILFHKWTAIFKFNINFNFFTNFIFLKCFYRYLKMWKIANLGYGNGRNSKTIHPIYLIFGRHMQKTNIYKTTKSCFWFFFQILNYVIKFPDWPLPGYHGNRVKNPASWFCANCSYVPPSQVWKYCENWFLSYVCYRFDQSEA